RIAEAIYDQVKPQVRLNAIINRIRRTGPRVRIEHSAGFSEADFCICTLPMPVLARIPSDFSSAKKAALGAVDYRASVKVAFEAPRFWERDDSVFGGLAWTDRLNENVMYPSGGYGDDKGVLVAAYAGKWTRPENPDAFAALTHEQRLQICRDSVE